MIDNPRIWRYCVNGEIIDHPRLYDSGYVVINPEIDTELNAHGSLKFTIANSHPLYDSIKTIGALVTVYNGTDEVFRGRVLDTTRDFYNNLEVYCEGQLAFFCDSLMQPFAFKGSVTEFLTTLIDNHNSQVDSTRQFSLGNVTVTDPDNNGVLVRSSDSALTTWEIISSRLLDALGGYLFVRKSGTTYYIDYLADIAMLDSATQTVEFGENLLDLDEYITADDVVTVLMPFGAKIEEDGTNANDTDTYQEEPEDSGTTLWHGNRVTIRSVNDGNYYIEDEDGVKLWGRIWGTNVWDDVTEPANLLTKAKAWLEDSIKSSTTMTLTAVDLHLVDVDIERINLGDFVRVYSRPHNLNRYMSCIKIHTEPKHPDNSSITLGATEYTLTRSLSGGKGIETRIQALEGDSEYQSTQINQNSHSITNNRYAIDTLSSRVTKIETLEADSAFVTNLNATYATITNLETATGRISTLESDHVSTTDLTATNARISTLESDHVSTDALEATNAEITKLQTADATITGNLEAATGRISTLESDHVSTTDLEATNAEITNLQAADVTITGNLEAATADIAALQTNKLDAATANITYATIDKLESDYVKMETLEAKYAQIDFANVGVANIGEFFSKSGIIENVITENGTVTGELVGVTIKGDLIEGNTIVADKLVIKGDDGLYYKLNVDALGETTASADEKYQNGLDGSVIIAQSITADRITVSDLVAFGATIGGLVIEDGSLHSYAKASVDNTTSGFYLGKDGQLSFGDADSYVKYYKDSDENWCLDLQANKLLLSSGKTVEEAISAAANDIDGDEIISRINLDSTTATIAATHINLVGAVTISSLAEDTSGALETAQSNATTAMNRSNSHYATCDTEADTARKVAVCDGFELYTGATVCVKFTYANTAENPRLNVNGTGMKIIQLQGDYLDIDAYWAAKDTVQFTYDGTYWVMSDTSAKAKLASWCAASDVTYIDGGKIYTGTVTADQIAANTITADKIKVEDLFAQDISATGNISFSNGYYRLAGESGGVFLEAGSDASNYISLKGNRVLMQGLDSDTSARVIVNPENDLVMIDADESVTITAPSIVLNGSIGSAEALISTSDAVTISNILTANGVKTNSITALSDPLSVNGNASISGTLGVTGALNANGGQIEIYGPSSTVATPYIDFHYYGSDADYTSRIIESASEKLNFIAENGVLANGKQVMTVYSSSSGDPNGNWRYLQYGNSKGTVFKKECWINKTSVSPSSASSFGSGYIAYFSDISFPFAFDNNPVVSITAWLGGYVTFTCINSVSTSKVGFYAWSPINDLSGQTFTVSIHAVGK